MKRSRFTEEQIIAMIKEQEAGMPTGGHLRRRLHRARQDPEGHR